MNSLIALGLGFILDVIFGDPYFIPHPIRYIGKAISKFEEIIRRERDSCVLKKIKGFIILGVISFGTFIFYKFILDAAYSLNNIFGIMVESFVIYQILATKCLMVESMKVYKALKNKDIELAKLQISYLVTRETKNMSEEDILKACVETVAENIVDGIISPMFFIIIGGAPLGMFYKAVNTLDSMIGYKNEKYLDFGMASARFDDVLNFIPARITGLIIPIVALFLGFDFKNSFRVMVRDRKNHSSPNSPFSEAAVAGALNIQLGGKATYFGVTTVKQTMGDNLTKIKNESIKDVNRIMYGTTIFFLLASMIFKVVLI